MERIFEFLYFVIGLDLDVYVFILNEFYTKWILASDISKFFNKANEPDRVFTICWDYVDQSDTNVKKFTNQNSFL